jgi:transcription initiation factor TFIID subunit 7
MRLRGAWNKNLANPRNLRDGDETNGSPQQKSTNHNHLNDNVEERPQKRVRLQIPADQKRRRAKSKLITTRSSDNESEHDTGDVEGDLEMSDLPKKSDRPSLKLSFSKPAIPQANNAAQTPNPQSAVRTPSIKLKFGGTPTTTTPLVATPGSISFTKKKKKKDTDTPVSSGKKRKRPSNANDSEDELSRPAHKPPAVRKITFKGLAGPTPTTATSTSAPVLKLKSKGKIPKRPLGVGYDSELEEREVDPVVLEGFILRMPPGPDCDFLRKAIEDGTIGSTGLKGGTNVSLRMLDTLGRRGIMKIRGNQYATTLVDLPCIIEGMKSWDKKGWIKSIDVSQMLLVLGRCNTDDEARNYPLPPDVDSKNHQYAHGLTPPMKWVRKRRFARTKRARVDDIEAIERRVNALLEADRAAISTRYQLLDHDPRLDEERYSSGLEDEDADAEGEDDGMDGYFNMDNGAAEASTYTETPVGDIGQDEVDEFERMFAGDDEVPPAETNSQSHTLHPPEQVDSSFALTSTSASPMATAAPTPASVADHTSDDEDGVEELDDDEREAKEELIQAKEKIASFEKKIEEHMVALKSESNAILKRRRAQIIQGLKQDIAEEKRKHGLGGDDDGDDDE